MRQYRAGSIARIVALLLIPAALSLSKGAIPASAVVSCAGTFSTAGETVCQIPSNVATISITAIGGAGGLGGLGSGAAGKADQVQAIVPLPLNGVGPGGTLYIEVAGNGGDGGPGSGGAGGANGGAAGGSSLGGGGGGGGASDVRTCAIGSCTLTTNDTRQVVAAGGAGAGSGGGGDGGNAGLSGKAGAFNGDCATPGQGGTSQAGGGIGGAGAGGCFGGGSGSNGSLGSGGAGGNGAPNSGGGGGGGYFGGGGGGGGGLKVFLSSAAGGGGGGTDFVTSGAISQSIVQGVSAAPSVTISFASSTLTTLTSAPNPSAPGQAVTFTASVGCNGFTPTGSVTFRIDGAAGTPVPLSGTVANFTTSSLGPGNHTVTASYSGDGNCAAATSNPLTQVVGTAGGSVSLASSQNPSLQGQPLTFTATVACPGFTPGGTVTFTVDGTAGTPVTLSGGTATFTASSLSAGSHSVMAAYSGDGNCGPATSGVLTQTVNAVTNEQPVGYGYCYPAANAPPPGAPCTPYTGSGAYQSPAQSAFQYCVAKWQTVAQQQACIAQALGNVGGFICAIGCPAPSGGAATGSAGVSPASLPGAYCTMPGGARQWVPQGAPAPAGCT
jgi:hypothetical protein